MNPAEFPSRVSYSRYCILVGIFTYTALPGRIGITKLPANSLTPLARFAGRALGLLLLCTQQHTTVRMYVFV